ncbi:MAG: YciI family protein [Actinomycetota bacterium]
MQVMMLIQETPEDFADRSGPAAEAYWGKWMAYSATVGDKVVGGNILGDGSTGVTITVRDGERQIQDGPFADSKESLGGYMIFEVDSMDEAIELAANCPAAASAHVELRPTVDMQPPTE